MKDKKFTAEDEKLARYAKALGHPVRVFILRLLSKQDCCYSGDLAEELPIARSTLSQHLSELKEAGLIQGEINPPKIRYCINEPCWKEAQELLLKLIMPDSAYKASEKKSLN
jgi:ArsR family transcriptional regulator, arsenate/arsenite/antimonite-responsive transcriptional repressor